MVHSFRCSKRNVLLDAIGKSFKVIKIHDKQQNPENMHQHSLVSVQFNGQEDSFKICCANATSKRQLRDYGLHSLEIILSGMCQIFNNLGLHQMHTIHVAHGQAMLITFVNAAQQNLPHRAGFLDICEVMERSAALSRENLLSSPDSCCRLTDSPKASPDICIQRRAILALLIIPLTFAAAALVFNAFSQP